MSAHVVYVDDDSQNQIHEGETVPSLGNRLCVNGRVYEVTELDEPRHGYDVTYVYCKAVAS